MREILKLLRLLTIVCGAVATAYSGWIAAKAAFDEFAPNANRELLGKWICVAACQPHPPAIIEQDPSAPSALRFYAENKPASANSGSYEPDARLVRNGDIYGMLVHNNNVINWMRPGPAPTGSRWDEKASNTTAWVRWPVQWRLIGAALFGGIVVGVVAHALLFRYKPNSGSLTGARENSR